MSSYLSISDIEERGEIFLGEPQPTKLAALKKTTLAGAVALATYLGVFACVSPFQASLPQALAVVNPFSIVGLVDVAAVAAPEAASKEVFEIRAPLAAPLGAYVSTQQFFNETALTGSLSVEYEAPADFNFTGALFGLNFSVGGVQEPAIFEIYVDEHPIWRTSTPNPLGALVNSSTIKNVSEFLPLFTADSTISFQLIDGDITGDVNVTFGGVFYNDSLSGVPEADVEDVESVFFVNRPADVIVPLSKKGKPLSLPKDAFTFDIPQLSSNVTQAKAKFFASASKEETKYYESVINGPFGGPSNGPVRFFNVFLEDIFVGSFSPDPTLLKADKVGEDLDFAKSLVPLAAPGAFDALEYEIDLSILLPLLWEAEAKLTVEIISPVKSSTVAKPTVPGPVPPPGTEPLDVSEWLVSGNFFAWESEVVDFASGEVFLTDSEISGTGILIAPPFSGISNEIVRASTQAGIQSQLNITLVDGFVYNFTAKFNASSHAIITRRTKVDQNALTYISVNRADFVVLDDSTGLDEPVFARNFSGAFPFSTLETKAASTVYGGAVGVNSLEVSLGSDVRYKVNDVLDYGLKNKFNSTVDDVTYATEARVREVSESHLLPYSRQVTAENGTIVSDLESFDLKSYESEAIEAQVSVLNDLIEDAIVLQM